MKKVLFISLLLSIFLFNTDCGKRQINSDITRSADLLGKMTDPPASYRPAPLWDWNDLITQEEIQFQMKKFKEGGIGGVFVHPRPGLVTEYLSKDWNELFDYTVQIAKDLGMEVWIYDENSYPSGFAGGHVQARFPESYNQGTGLGCKVTHTLADTAGLEIEAILEKTSDGFRLITSATISTLPANSADSSLYLFYRTHPATSYWFGGFPYVDLIHPGVTDTFMKVTMEGYEKYNREDFGHTLKGIFTDEPNLEAAKGPGTLIRWTPDLFEQFEKRWGYALQPNLVSLIKETGDWMKVRHDYFTLILELFLDRWAVPWYNYCEKNNLDWTGHYWEHGWPYPGDGIDELAFYMYHQMPGVDMLGRSYDSSGMEGQFGNTRAIRELGSSASQAGWKRQLSETWGGAGWQISFAELKRLVDWEVVLGVNFVNPHLSYYSMQGVRKFDYPPTFSYQEPWWDRFSLLGDYIGRICLAISAGEQINKILILQPNTTAWMYHSRSKNHPAILELSKTFKAFLQNLESAQFEYDLGSEQVLKRFAETNRKGLKIRNRTYDHLVLPPGMRNIESSTLALLENYLEVGRTVLCLSDSIDYIDGKPDSRLKTLAEQYPFHWIKAADMASDKVISYFENPDFILQKTNIEGGQIFHQRRILDDSQLLFLVNSDLLSEASFDATLPGKHLVEINLSTGGSVTVPVTPTGTKLSFAGSIAPGGSRLFLVTTKKIKADAIPAVNELSRSLIEPEGQLNTKRLSPNIFTIDYLDLETRTQQLQDVYFMNAMYALFKESGLKTGNPWQHKIQYRQQYLEMDKFQPDSWFKVRYKFIIDSGLPQEIIAGLEAVIERPDIWQIYLNGKQIQPTQGQWWTDRHFPLFAIGQYAKTGENLIELKAPRMSVFAEIMPIYILGDFALEPSEKGFIIKPPAAAGLKPWKEAGMPFYCNKVAYIQNYMIDKPEGGYQIELTSWTGSVAEVLVNGKSAGTIGWSPYNLDVTSLITPGSNKVEVRVTGTFKNTFGFHHRDLSGWIFGPFSWNEAPEKQPAGSTYRIMDYGMFSTFNLVNTR